MPQMPNGPGAPSDVGPDGGLVDPGMIGPDGMPPDDGGPPPPPGIDGEEDGEPGDPDGDPSEDDDSGPPPPPKGKSKKKSSLAPRYRGTRGQVLTEEQMIRHVAVAATGGDPQVMARLRRQAMRRTADWEPGRFAPYRTLSSGHRVMIGKSGGGWAGTVHSPDGRHMHLMDLGQGGDPREAAERALAGPDARSFVHATTPRPDDAGSFPASTTRHSDWWNSPQDLKPADTPFHSASRRPSVNSKKSGIVTAMRTEPDHESMSSGELRRHMRGHGYRDTPDDPDWVIEEEHRNQHADFPHDHVHRDLEDEHNEDIHLGDRDWLGQHGIEMGGNPRA